MNHLKFFSEITKNSVFEAGGKGASLGEMSNAGILVPPGFVILANAFDRFVEESHLKEEISARLNEVNPEDTNSVDKASNVIRDVIHDHPMPDDLATEILEAYEKLGAEFVAVRSSATAEDSAIASWAGELETYLNTSQDNILERVKLCWSSLYTPRAIFYRHEKNLIDHYVSVAVVVQKMVQADVSGIAFTVHPVTQDPDQLIIEAGYGLGEAIVSGSVTPDSYIVSKGSLSILDIAVNHQTKKMVRSREQNNKLDRENSADEEAVSNEWIKLSESEGGKQKLSGRQIIECAQKFIEIEAHYGFPCDIEWAIENGNLYITQSRPITTLSQV